MPAKVFIVDQSYKADYRVCFVDHDYQQKNHQLLTGGKLAKNSYEADVKVCIVAQAYQADILITRKNFPR